MGVSKLQKQDFLALPAALAEHNAVALVFEDVAFTYAQLHEAVRQTAAVAWHDWGVRPGDRVAWLGASHCLLYTSPSPRD